VSFGANPYEDEEEEEEEEEVDDGTPDVLILCASSI